MRAYARVDHRDLPPETAALNVRAIEGLSQIFEVYVEFICSHADLDLASMLWSTAAVTIAGGSASRSFHGVIEESRYLGRVRHGEGEWSLYSLRLRPSVHGLKYRIRSRIFQNLNAVDVIKQVFTDSGIPADTTRWDLSFEYGEREYCTQWKESELDFVSRLLEHEGIFYWFEHTEVDHTLCFGDASTVHESVEGDPVFMVRRRAGESGHLGETGDALWEVEVESRVTHDAVLSRDWNFVTPQSPLEATSGSEDGIRTSYEYPGGYADNGEGGVLAGVRYDEANSRRRVLRASADSPRLAPGRKLELAEVYPESLVGEYTVLHVEHTWVGDRRGRTADGQAGVYTQRIQAVPSATNFRPPRVTPRPIADGLESAVVTGPPGEEIHVDEFGRVKVHFYWDRENPVDDTASCWIRFQQLNTQGAMILPRLGWELHVAFENGDPDRPIAIHKAYNQETMPPYEQPANKTQSALQSSTTPGGGSTNEIRMQDGNGGMEFFMHASKDVGVVVANDENETVGVDSTETCGADMTSDVGGDEQGTIGANQAVSVTGNSGLSTTGAKKVTIGANDDWGITGNFGFSTGASRTDDIGGLMNVLANNVDETFNANLKRDVGAVQAIISATAISETVGGSKTETTSGAKAIITPKEVGEKIAGLKTLNSGAATFKVGDDVNYAAEGAIAVTAAGLISIKCGDDAMFNGSQVRVTCGKADFKGGGGEFKLSSSITIDAKKFGGKGGPQLKLKGNIDYK